MRRTGPRSEYEASECLQCQTLKFLLQRPVTSFTIKTSLPLWAITVIYQGFELILLSKLSILSCIPFNEPTQLVDLVLSLPTRYSGTDFWGAEKTYASLKF
jgi:hypothetical protein